MLNELSKIALMAHSKTPENPPQDNPPEDPEPDEEDLVPLTKLREAFRQRDETKARNQKLQAQIADLESRALSDEDLEAFQNLKTEAEARKVEEEVKAGEFEEVRRRDKELHQKALDTLKSEHAEEMSVLNATIDNLMINSRIETEAVKAGVSDADGTEKIPALVAILSRRVRRVSDGNGGFSVECVGENDETIYADDGTPLDVSGLVRQYVKKNPFYVTPQTGESPTVGHRIGGNPPPKADFLKRTAIDNLAGLYEPKDQ